MTLAGGGGGGVWLLCCVKRSDADDAGAMGGGRFLHVLGQGNQLAGPLKVKPAIDKPPSRSYRRWIAR